MAGGVGEPKLMHAMTDAIVAASPEPLNKLEPVFKRNFFQSLDENGPGFHYGKDSSPPFKLRATRSFFLTMDFLMSSSGVSSLRKVLRVLRSEGTMKNVAHGGSIVARMLPQNHGIWSQIVELIIDSQFAKDRMRQFNQDQCRRGEWRSLSIDGTSKVASALKHRQPKLLNATKKWTRH